MMLVQLLLPVAAAGHRTDEMRAAFTRTREELVERFGGVTAHAQAPAEGIWTTPEGDRDVDRMIMVEVVTPAFDRDWWRRHAATLAKRFGQDTIHVRAVTIEMVDDRAV
jgi:hypothetical protein